VALITLTRREWVAVLNQLDASHFENDPPGLAERIAYLLAATPAAWPDQACNLELSDLTAADLVHAIVHEMHMQSVEPGFVWQEDASVAEAEQIIRNHQDRHDLI
jgi:hypothetical protein